MSPDSPSRWDGPRARTARAALVLVTSLASTAGYAVFLNKTYPVKDWLFWRVGALWGFGLLLSLACVSFGHLILARVLRITGLPTLETVVSSAAVGLVGFVLGMYAIGFLHQFNAVFAILLPLAMLLAGARPLLHFIRDRRAAFESSPPPRDTLTTGVMTLAWVFGVVGAVFVYLGAMTPDAINFDSSWSHIPIAADYARAGRIIPFAGDYTRNVPHLASLVHTWAFIVPGLSIDLRWMMALHLEFFFFLWTLAGVAAMAHWLAADEDAPNAPAPRGTWAAFFLFPAIFIYDNNLGGGADHYLAFFAPPLFLAAVRAMQRFDARACALMGIFAGGALLTKYQAVYLVFGVGLAMGVKWVAFAAARVRARRSGTMPPVATESTSLVQEPAPPWRELIVGPLVIVGVCLLVASPHFLKNAVFYKNPVYPFAIDTFKGSTPAAGRAGFLFEWLFKDYNWRPHGTLRQNLLQGLGLTFSFSFVPHYSFTKSVPNTGSLFTLTLPFLLFLRAPKRLWIGAVAGLGCTFMWAMTFRVDRHLQTFLPLLAASTAAVVVRAWEMGWLARAGLVPLVCLQVIWGGDAYFYSGHQRIKSAIELIRGGFEGKRDGRFKYRSEFRDLNKALPPDAKVILHNYRPNLGVDRDIFLDWPGQQGLILYEGIKTPRALYDYWKSLGITHLLHIPGRRATQTKQDDVLFTNFVTRYGKKRRFGSFELVELPASPPPQAQPYKVLAVGLAGYRDGLYPIEAMKTYEGMPKHMVKFPAPEVPVPKVASLAVALLGTADAVLEGRRGKIDPELKEALSKDFTQGQSYGRSFTIWLRKNDGSDVRAPVAPGSSASPEEHAPEAPPGADDDDERE